jgi:hypothetical protein
VQRLCFALLAIDCPTPPQPLPFAALSPTAPELAAEALRSANNGFVLQSAALVLMMTPALAIFDGDLRCQPGQQPEQLPDTP